MRIKRLYGSTANVEYVLSEYEYNKMQEEVVDMGKLQEQRNSEISSKR